MKGYSKQADTAQPQSNPFMLCAGQSAESMALQRGLFIEESRIEVRRRSQRWSHFGIGREGRMFVGVWSPEQRHQHPWKLLGMQIRPWSS